MCKAAAFGLPFASAEMLYDLGVRTMATFRTSECLVNSMRRPLSREQREQEMIQPQGEVKESTP